MNPPLAPVIAAAPRWPRVLVRVLLGGMGLLLVGLLALWSWAGTEGALGNALRGVSAWLPQGHALSVQAVQGRLRSGGDGGSQSARIGQLIYTAPGLRVQAEQVTLTLDAAQLWQGRLPLMRLQMGNLQIQDQRPATPKQSPADWTLPLDVRLDWQVDRLDWQATPAVTLTQLQGTYAYAAQGHTLILDSAVLAQGRYRGQASLQAVQPMALQAQLTGQVQTPQTGRMASVPVDAQLRVQGELGSMDAVLQLTAKLTPQSSSAMQANVSMQIQPWQTQVIPHAQGQWRGVDLAQFWPGAPSTLLDGELTASPSASSRAFSFWQGALRLNNQRPGPWDRQLLPIQSLQAQLSRSDGLWQVDELQARIGGGQVQGQGRETAQGWVGQLQLDQVQPAQLLTALSGPAWQGQVKAQTLASGAVQVQANLGTAKSEALPSTQAALLNFKGQWQAGVWEVQQMEARLADAVLSGQGRMHTTGPVLQGQWQLAWPGMSLQMTGEAAPTRGQGQLQVKVSDVARAAAWLQRWPVEESWLRGRNVAGQAELSGHWQGGWQHKDSQLSLDWKVPFGQFQSAPQAEPVQLKQAQGQLRGTLAAMQTQWQGQAQQGLWLAQLNARLSLATPWSPQMGVQSGSQSIQPEWQGQLQALELDVKHSRQASGWQLQLPQAVGWRFITSTPTSPTLAWQAGALQLRGPTPGLAQLRWSAGQWALAQAEGLTLPDTAQLQVDDVPLAWASAFGVPQLQGDVLLQGRVDVKSSHPLALSAVLERSRGDLLLPLEGANQALVPAGLREARAQLNITGPEAKLNLAWDSEQLGQLSAQGQTQLSRRGEWLSTAPITGSVKSSLRRVGVWSLLAPPGWRVQGTLDTAFEISGTRGQPRWQGTLAADQLTVRSAVQGMAFTQGQLRAKLQDQRVELTQLSFQGEGGQGGQGGQLQAQGTLNWLQSPNELPGLKQVRVALKLQAQGLRVSNRADRRLAISGAVDAQLDQGQLRLKGRVQADHALFILPENTTPTLGDDVVVHRRGAPAAAALPVGVQPSPLPSWVGLPEVQLALDLGPDFQVQGQGLQARLSGVLNLSSSAATQGVPRLSGDVRTEGGRYKAYGQTLNIETGLLRFNGPFNNPDLDIVAIRPNLSQRVGVAVSGTALQPRIQLFSDPDLPDAEKLAWLVLGRSGADGGAESAMLQQAAVTLLSRDGKGIGTQLAGALGLDEVSLGRGSRSDSTATGAAISLGKRVSRDVYLVYESSLSGTFGSLYMFYDLSRRFKLRAQTGDQNAVDVIFTVRKD